MELGVIIGFVSGIIFTFLSILLNADMQISALISFFDPPSVMITIGGAIASTLIANPLPKVITSLKAVSNIINPKVIDPIKGIKEIINFANLARKEGLLALEDASANSEDEFLKKGVMLVVDGTDPELVRNILETELSFVETRHKEVIDVWDYIGGQTPAWGMIGTLIGLVMMLQNMSDPSAIGPSMAVALITTFYGSIVANFIAIPISTKMKIYSGQEALVKEILIEGILSIQAGENPRIIEEKLKVFLSPDLRKSVSQEEAAGGE